MRRPATSSLLIALWLGGCGGVIEGDDSDPGRVATTIYALTTVRISNLCSGECRINDGQMCVGNAYVTEPLNARCKPESDSCSAGQFRQCPNNCSWWQVCEGNRWGSCEPVPSSWPSYCDSIYVDDLPAECEIRARESTSWGDFDRDFSCRTETIDDDDSSTSQSTTTRRYPDLRPTFDNDYPRISGSTLYVRGKVCNRGEVPVEGSTDLRIDFSSGLELRDKTLRDAIGRLDRYGYSGACDSFDEKFELDDDVEEGYHEITLIADAGDDEPEGRSGEDNNEVEKRIRFDGSSSSSSSSSSKSLNYDVRLHSLDCSAKRGGDKVECEVTVCYNEDTVRDTEVKVGVYFDTKNEPSCGDDPDSKEGKDFTLSSMDGNDECREETVRWEVEDDDETSIKVYAVADVDCEYLAHEERGRAKTETVRLRRDEDDGAVVESTACGLGGAPGANLPPLVLLLALRALFRRRAR